MAISSGSDIEFVFGDDPVRDVSHVIALAGTQKQTLGFLPDAAFIERARRGTLLTLVDTTRQGIGGFALYDLVGERIRLRQLCIDPHVRGHGLARRLVDELFRRHPAARNISLWCRKDYEANRVWPRLGFAPRGERAGRKLDGSTLVHWVRFASDADHGTLFELLQDDDRLHVAIDNNVLYDLHDLERSTTDSQGLLADWIQAELNLCVTPQVLQEIHEDKDPARRERQRVWAQTHTERLAEVRLQSEVASQLESVAPSNTTSDRGDVQHVAAAAAAGLQVFITRDENLIRRLRSAALAIAQVDIMTPAEAVGRRLETLVPARYQPTELFGLTYEERRVRVDEVDALTDQFAFSHAGGSRRALRNELRLAMSQPDDWTTGVVRRDGVAIALVVRRAEGTREVVRILRVLAEPAHTLARQLLARLKLLAAGDGRRLIAVQDPTAAQLLADAMMWEQYWPTDGQWVSVCDRQAARGRELCARLLESPDLARHQSESARLLALGPDLHPLQHAQLEELFWPSKCVDGPMPTFLIPIKPQFVDHLLGVTTERLPLFSRPEGLGLSREHVYYKSPRGPVPTVPARLLWYRSGEHAALIACSRLTEMVVAPVQELHHRFSHLGVLELEDIHRVAHQESALALRFQDTELFDRPVGLKALRAIAGALGHTLVLQSPSRVPEQMFESVYQEAFGAAP